MEKKDFIKRMHYLLEDPKEILKKAFQQQRKIIESYENKKEGIEESQYFLSSLSSPNAYSYMDPLYIELIADTYVSREKKDAYLERSFLFNPDVLEAGSEYASSIIKMNRGKSEEVRTTNFFIFSRKENIDTLKNSLSSTSEDIDMVRSYQKKKMPKKNGSN